MEQIDKMIEKKSWD